MPVPLLDTLKVVHIWYTTVTINGWLASNLMSPRLVIGNMKSGILSAPLTFQELGAHVRSSVGVKHGELQNE
jgi:hypothetical protein